MAFVQTAIAKIAENNKKVYAAQSIVEWPADERKTLDAAIKYVEDNQEKLRSGESFEIYYRCEEVKDERNN